jgi:hypothetical protein
MPIFTFFFCVQYTAKRSFGKFGGFLPELLPKAGQLASLQTLVDRHQRAVLKSGKMSCIQFTFSKGLAF